MGGIHPRPKQTVGRRLALAAKAIAYGDAETVYTGPVIKSCTVYPGELREKTKNEISDEMIPWFRLLNVKHVCLTYSNDLTRQARDKRQQENSKRLMAMDVQ